MINEIWRQELLKAGFTREHPETTTQVQHDGFQYTKEYRPEPNVVFQIGVYVNPEFGGMQVYGCDCVIACCGTEVTQGITPYSLDKVNQLVEDFIKEYN